MEIERLGGGDVEKRERERERLGSYARKHQDLASPSRPPTPSSSSSSFIPVISTVAVAQICLSIGYTSAEPSALRSLSNVASLYLQSLAKSAASIANSRGRTQSNLLDLIRAVEDLTVARGFTGASDPTRSLLKSSVLKGLRAFVRSVDEIPFPKPIRNGEGLSPLRARVSAASFAELGRDPPLPHVPRWLPCFPEEWESGGRIEEKRERRSLGRRRWEEKEGSFEKSADVDLDSELGLGFEEEEGEWVGNGGIRGVWNKKSQERELMKVEGRERVRFKLELMKVGRTKKNKAGFLSVIRTTKLIEDKEKEKK